MPLSAEQVYDELSGAEVKAILLERVRALLDSVPDFQKHLTLPRVRMALNIHLDIYGRRNTALDLINDFTVTTREPEERMQLAESLEAEDQVNADTGVAIPGTPFDGTGEPPDLIREQNGLTLLEPVKDRATMSTQQRPIQPPPVAPPVIPPMQPSPPPGGRRYAAFRVLEREGPVVMGFTDYKQGAEPWTKEPQAQMGQREIGIQKDFREAHKPPEKP